MQELIQGWQPNSDIYDFVYNVLMIIHFNHLI
jgi:hypothetical protein